MTLDPDRFQTIDLALPDEGATARLGAALAGVVRAGDTLLLEGAIGAGKSHLARALIQEAGRGRGADVPEVPSPTFTLIQTYQFHDLQIVHADLYRLGDTSELAELGLEDAFGRALCLVEWPDRLGAQRHRDAVRIALRPMGEGRRATLTRGSAEMADRLGMLLAEGSLP